MILVKKDKEFPKYCNLFCDDFMGNENKQPAFRVSRNLEKNMVILQTTNSFNVLVDSNYFLTTLY